VRAKRVRQHKENYYHQTQRNYVKTAAHNLDKYCSGTSGVKTEDKRCGLSLIDGNRVQPTIPTVPYATKSRTLHSNSATSYYQQKIPRFERTRVGTICSNSGSLAQSCSDNAGSVGGEKTALFGGPAVNTLTIKCNLSASCSSLSSISSLSSGSASPPMSASAHTANTTTPWSVTPPRKQVDSSPAKATNQFTGQLQPNMHLDDVSVMKCDGEKKLEKSLKAYANKQECSPVSVIPQKFIPDSSSLFCSQLDGKVDLVGDGSEQSQSITASEYSLFGPRGFVTSFAR